MGVVGATLNLGVRRVTQEVDGYGTPTTAQHGPLEGPQPGRVVSEPEIDGSPDSGEGVTVLALDPSFWPIAAGDWIEDVDGDRVWTVRRATYRPNDVDVTVSYIRVVSALNSG